MKKHLRSRFLAMAVFGAAATLLSSCVGAGVGNAPPSGVQPLPNLTNTAATVGTAQALLTSGAPPAYQVVYPFGGGLGGGNAATQLVFDPQGNAYGTTVQGGNSGCGTVFRLHRTSSGLWNETVLYSFSCFSDGKNPHGGVVRDAQGNLYGTTTSGGAGGRCTGDGCGVVFKVTPGGSESVLHAFTGKDDGFGPGSQLAFDSSGNLYGTAPDAGKYAHGTIFALTPSGGSWHFGVIHQFTGGTDGANGSLGALFVDAHGDLYGVAELGGAHNVGVAYKMNRSGSSWNFATIYAFKGTPDAASPYGGLIQNGGKLYGTTYYGGAGGLGTVYELTPSAGSYSERVLYSFKGGSDGSSSTSTLLAGPDGALYGTTAMGGGTSCDCGTVFSLAKATFAESVLHRFGGRHDGHNPYYGFTQFGSSLYSSTVFGGTSGMGTIFSITP